MPRGADTGYYRSLWGSMRVLPDFERRLDDAAQRISQNKGLYASAERLYRVPREIFGLTHYREASCNPLCQILNGQYFNAVTTLVPAGLGPWDSWEAAAGEAVRRGNWAAAATWNVPAVLALLERHNGGGYLRRGVASPYLWSGTQHGLGVGKYVADGRYDPMAIDKQLGCAVLWRKMIDRFVWSLTVPLEPLELHERESPK